MIGSTLTGEDLTLQDNAVDGNTVTVTQAKAAFTHISSDGTEHTYIDQDVRTSASPTFANVIVTDEGYAGLGAAKGRIEFHDETVDVVAVMDARFGLGTDAPDYLFHAIIPSTGVFTQIARFEGDVGYIRFVDDDRAGFQRMILNVVNNVLSTDDSHIAFGTGVDGETYSRFGFTNTGRLVWGVGAADYDVALYRWQAASLRVTCEEGFPLSIHRNDKNVNHGVVFSFELDDSADNAVAYADIVGNITTNTAGSEDGRIALRSMNSGTMTEHLRAINDGTVIIGATTSSAGLLDVNGDISTREQYLVDGTQVVTNRQTGWGAPTGTATRTTFATGTVALSQLAERVHALIDDLTTHGLIGA